MTPNTDAPDTDALEYSDDDADDAPDTDDDNAAYIESIHLFLEQFQS